MSDYEELREDDESTIDSSDIMVGGRKMMSLEARQFISAMHWLAFIMYLSNAIISLVDGLVKGSDPEDYAYDSESAAAAAGVSANIGDISYGVYLALSIASVAFSAVAWVWDWFIYRGTNFMGMDLTYNCVDEWSMQFAEERAKRSFSPRGTAYRSMYATTFMSYITTLALMIHAIANDRPINRFSMVLVPWAAVLAVFFGFAVYYVLYVPVDSECLQVMFTEEEAREMTSHINRHEAIERGRSRRNVSST